MIARIWQGTVPLTKAEAYLDLMTRVALPDYTAVAGVSVLGDGLTQNR
jgi:hypothetical protein